MFRLLIHVEGQTEETFVNEVLAKHLHAFGYQSVGARLIGDPRQRRGGIQGWDKVRRDILNHLKQDRNAYHTTMIDYYGLPQFGAGAWPGRENASNAPFLIKAEMVQNAMLHDLARALGDVVYPVRFIPFVVMHEFEGLLFSDCEAFARGIGRTDLRAKFQVIRDAFNSPEEIDDSPDTAPSKRVKGLLPNYEKPFLGSLAALEIGIDEIRSQCKNFDNWLKLLEELPNKQSKGE